MAPGSWLPLILYILQISNNVIGISPINSGSFGIERHMPTGTPARISSTRSGYFGKRVTYQRPGTSRYPTRAGFSSQIEAFGLKFPPKNYQEAVERTTRYALNRLSPSQQRQEVDFYYNIAKNELVIDEWNEEQRKQSADILLRCADVLSQSPQNARDTETIVELLTLAYKLDNTKNIQIIELLNSYFLDRCFEGRFDLIVNLISEALSADRGILLKYVLNALTLTVNDMSSLDMEPRLNTLLYELLNSNFFLGITKDNGEYFWQISVPTHWFTDSAYAESAEKMALFRTDAIYENQQGYYKIIHLGKKGKNWYY